MRNYVVVAILKRSDLGKFKCPDLRVDHAVFKGMQTTFHLPLKQNKALKPDIPT